MSDAPEGGPAYAGRSGPSTPPPAPPDRAVRRGLAAFRWYSSLTFAFAWVPVMYTAFTVDRGFTPSQYMQLWGAYYGAMVLAELPWGRLADRWSRRALLRLGPCWLALCFVGLGETRDFTGCLALMAAVGTGHAMISGADSAYLYEMLAGAGRRREALAEETRAHAWRLFGVSILDVLGGFVAFAWGTRWAFHASAGVMLLAALAALALPRAVPHAGRPALAAASAPLRPVPHALRQPGVAWALLWFVAVFVLLRIGFQLYQPTLLAAGAADLRLHGLTLGALNLVAGLSSFFVLRVHARLGERGTSVAVLAALAVSFAGLAVLPAWSLVPLFCLQQVSFAFMQPVGRTALNHRIPGGERAALLSVQSLLARLAFALLLVAGDWDAALDVRLEASYGVLALAAALLALLCRRMHPGRPPALESGTGD